MSHHINLNKSFLTLLFLGQITPIVLAHNIKTSNNVAATFHIEPNHNPLAGEPNEAWFALTKQGGKLIPLTECHCQLEVNLKSPKGGLGNGEKTEIQNSKLSYSFKPPLKSISAEKYQGIPGTEIVFPQSGEYELKLSGTPKTEGNFQPFEFSYTVTVRNGSNIPTVSPSPQAANTPQDGDKGKISQSSSQEKTPLFVLAGVLLVGAIYLIIGRLGRAKRNPTL